MAAFEAGLVGMVWVEVPLEYLDFALGLLHRLTFDTHQGVFKRGILLRFMQQSIEFGVARPCRTHCKLVFNRRLEGALQLL